MSYSSKQILTEARAQGIDLSTIEIPILIACVLVKVADGKPLDEAISRCLTILV